MPANLPCPQCGGRMDVKDTRPSTYESVDAICRRRCCRDCGHRVTTYEIIDGSIRRAEWVDAIVQELRKLRRGINAVITEADIGRPTNG